MLTSEAMLTLAAELADAQADSDAELLAAIAWQLYGEVGEDLAEIARLRAAISAAWNRPHEQPDQRQLRPERDQAGLTALEPRPATEARRELVARRHRTCR